MKAVIFQPRCKLWSCPYCAAINRDFWIAKTIHGTESLLSVGTDMRFVTLTSAPYVSREGSVKTFKIAWPKLRKRMARKNGCSVPYLLVTEHHLSGYLHVHMLLGAALSSHWFHDAAWACGLGYEAKSERVANVGQCAAYVAKYINKSIDHHAWPHKYHRVRASQNWPKMPDSNPLIGWEYEVVKDLARASFEAHYLEDAGYSVVWTDSRFAFPLMGIYQIRNLEPFEADDF